MTFTENHADCDHPRMCAVYPVSQEEPHHPSITCPKCGRTSYHPNDIREGYCGFCHDWTSPRANQEERPDPEVTPNPNRLCASPYCMHARSQHTQGADGACKMCECPGFHPVWLG